MHSSDFRPDLNANIACVFVLYYPEDSVIGVLRLMLDYGYDVIVVVNSSGDDKLADLLYFKNLRVIFNKFNLGLATALNQGISAALERNQINYVILFDQDSEPEATLPFMLANELNDLGEYEYACIGPRIIDKKSPHARYSNGLCSAKKPITIPTSGTLITRFSYNVVGPMLDKLFIDGIDHEWCFRARFNGLKPAVSVLTSMVHNMGDNGFKYLYSYKPIHLSPLRHYYITRNTIYLCKLSYPPFLWRFLELLKLVRRVVFYLLISSNRLLTAKLVVKALVHGSKNKLGPLHVI